jgi:hypothetical protein
MPEVDLTASKFSLRTWKLLGMCIILVFDNDLPILVCDEDVKPPWAILCNIYFSKCRFDGSSFVKNLEASVADRQKRGKPPRKIRYVHYCQWAHALLVSFFEWIIMNNLFNKNIIWQSKDWITWR